MDLTAAGRTEVLLWLADELRRLRGSRSRADAARRIGTTAGHIGHLETGRNPPSRMDIEGLLDLYGATDQVERLCALRDASRHAQDWWSEYADLLQSPVQAWLGLEAVAARLHTFDSHVLPALFQIAPYTEAVLRAQQASHEDQQRRLIEFEQHRQHIQNERADPAQLLAIIDEQVLHRLVGDATVMRHQLTHLARASLQPHVTIRVLPRDRGLHTSTDAAFAIATMPSHFGPHPGGVFVPSHVHRGWLQNPPDRDVAAIRQGACYRRQREIQTYRATWERLREQTLDPERSREIIEQTRRDW
ncbi:helix-turn-helix domain-containing protein [Amycolatopsis alkalitolerans]|uniref:Helix-turn-helix domain-containing protein n=1 Tax=Amycolatopsis alkalitolerans TaxID=2547244 RepID=A0A5C4LWP5_9PSEU|nr:helix-turn-helix transcriptional regulator [Amycolatopsis alkalitolerans]TNC22232.1 helix-turn-helix domain-containing protein [Amycolatopsis alkalitolerans]